MKEKQKLFFDGDCSFCNFWVKFISKNKRRDNFEFHSLQSDLGIAIIQKYNLENVDSIILEKEAKIYLKSNAALQIIKQLKFPWFLFFLGIILPKYLRDYLYEFIARNRRKIFKDSCEIHP